MSEINCWLQSSLERVFPGTPAIANNNIDIILARGERLSFQACVRNSTINAKPVVLSVDGPDEIAVRIRRVGYVPVAHHSTDTDISELDGVGKIPGLVPDPLFDGNELLVGPYETAAFWVNVTAPRDITPGVRELTVRFTSNDEVISELKAVVDVRSLVIEPRKDFPVTHWFYADAICDWYKVEPFEEKFWQVVKPYMQDVVDHGNNSMYVPIFTPPTDGVKRPTQLLVVSETSPGKYSFDFSNVRRWVTLAKECGAQYFEWTHLFWQWGVKYALRIYRDNADRESLLWPPETGATSETYLNMYPAHLQTCRISFP